MPLMYKTPDGPGCCFGVASRLLPQTRPTSFRPCGAKAMLLAKLPYAVGSFRPFGAALRAG